jgi:CRP-like cAMP-binding protein
MAIFELLRREPDVRSFRAGESIFDEGQTGDCMFVVLSGSVEIRKGDRVLERLEKDGVFGEMALIDHSPRSASAIAVSDCSVAALPEKRFTFLVQQTPYFALEVMHLLADRLRRNTAT